MILRSDVEDIVGALVGLFATNPQEFHNTVCSLLEAGMSLRVKLVAEDMAGEDAKKAWDRAWASVQGTADAQEER